MTCGSRPGLTGGWHTHSCMCSCVHLAAPFEISNFRFEIAHAPRWATTFIRFTCIATRSNWHPSRESPRQGCAKTL